MAGILDISQKKSPALLGFGPPDRKVWCAVSPMSKFPPAAGRARLPAATLRPVEPPRGSRAGPSELPLPEKEPLDVS